MMRPFKWLCHFGFLDVRNAAVGGLCLRSTEREANIRSKGNDNLAELAAVLKIAVHFHHIVELECTIDDRLERAAHCATSSRRG